MNNENNDDFLPGVGPIDNNIPSSPDNFDPNMNGGFDPNINVNNFDLNMNAGVDPNINNNNFDPNMNLGFDPNVNNNFDPNANNLDPNMMQNQFDPKIGQAPFDMNQNPNMDPNMVQPPFDMSQNINMDQNQFTPNMNSEFNPDVNNNFEQDTISSNYAEDFERNWMGSIYDKAHSKKFNFCAAFFGPAYLFYRKVYLTGGLTALILIIINIIISLLKLNNVGLILGINAIIMLIYFFGLGFGFYPIYRDFVHKQFNKYKKQIPDNNQLIALANKKGGTSILALIVYYIANSVVVTIMVYAMFASLMSDLFGKLPPQSNITSNNNIENNTNVISNETQDEATFSFTDGYELIYPDSTWVVGADKKSLIKGAYTLTYTVSYKASDLGVTDMSTAEGRSSILSIINNSVTSLATTNNLQMDPNDNFVSSNGTYYTYINLSSDTETTRYYFVLLPAEETLFQFELKINDTTVQSDTHLEITKILTKISNTSSANNLPNGNTVTNNTITNDTVTDNSTTNNTVTGDNNAVSNNITSNEVNNMVSENNTTEPNNTSISNVLRNTSI